MARTVWRFQVPSTLVSHQGTTHRKTACEIRAAENNRAVEEEEMEGGSMSSLNGIWEGESVLTVRLSP